MASLGYCRQCRAQRLDRQRYCGLCGFDFGPSDAGADTSIQEITPPQPADNDATEADQAATSAEDTAGHDGAARSRPRLTGLSLVTGAAALAAILSLAWGFMLSREIDRVRVELASVEIERASAISSLTQEKTARSEGEREIRSLSADNDSLRVQVARQEECIAALRERQVELSHIATLQTENYNRFVSDSVWGKAFAANQKAMSTAIDDYYNAYSRAFNGALSAANTWIDRGNTQVDKANKQLSVMNSEIEAGNQANQDIEGALSDVVTAILEAATTCGFSEVETPA